MLKGGMTMKKLAKLALYGLMLWAAVFLAAMALGSLRQTERPLFESLIAVLLALVTTLVAMAYLRKQRRNFLLEGLELGLMGLLVNIALDLIMFSYGPMRMDWLDYLKDIGLTYLMIPVITSGLGYGLDWQAALAGGRKDAYDEATPGKTSQRAL